MARQFSKVKEVVAAWNQVRQFLRSGDAGSLVPVVIPRDRRGYGPLLWAGLLLYWLLVALTARSLEGVGWVSPLALLAALGSLAILVISLRGHLLVEIEEGTMGVLSSWGEIIGTLPPGRQIIWQPWRKVEYVVDTATEIPYTAPVLSSPTQENVPLKSIEFFLKFRIVEPVGFVRKIGASNFDIVLSSAVQDAIRQRSRDIQTAQAYSLRGSDVSDMQRILNHMMQRYGIQVTGANIPDVQLPDQYRENLATRERVAKELAAYEKEWDLMRKRRKDALELEIEKAKKERDARRIAVNEAVNKARQDVALMLQEKEAEAERIRLDIEATGKARLKAAENEALALQRLGESYRDNQALLRYELATQQLETAAELMQKAPRPLVVSAGAQEGQSALNTLVLAQLLPAILRQTATAESGKPGDNGNPADLRALVDSAVSEARRRADGR